MMYLLQGLQQFAQACQPKSGSIIPTWYKYLGGETIAGRCTPVFDFPEDLGSIALAVVEILLRIVILVSIGFVVYGGFKYILSQGEPDKAKGARSTIINALIGVAIAVVATAIVSLVSGSLVR